MPSEPLPAGWTELSFGDMATHISERVDDPRTAGVEIYVGLEHLDPGDLRIRRRGVPDDVEAQKLRVRPGQIIFGKRRAYQRKVAVADFDGICSAHAMILEAKPVLAPGFLPFFMQSDAFMDRAVTISEGGLSPTIKWKTLAAEKFLLPPLEQQHELVELMQGFEAAIEAGEKVMGSASRLLMTLSNTFFVSKDSNDTVYRQEARELPVGWSFKPLREVADLQVGYAFKSANFNQEGTWKLLRGDNVGYGLLDWENKRYISNDSVDSYKDFALKLHEAVIGMDRTFTGSGYKVSRIRAEDLPCLLVQRVGRFSSKDVCDSGFLWFLINSDVYKSALKRSEKGMAVPHLSN